MDAADPSQAGEDGRSPDSFRADWSLAGLKAQLDTARSHGKGFASSHVAPYRPLGTPDVKRNRSFLPKSNTHYHSQFSQSIGNVELEDSQIGIEPLVLPTRLKECYWNGERWCGTPFLPRLASIRNGYVFLHDEIKNSYKRLIACRRGRYFLKSPDWTESKTNTKDPKPRALQTVLVPKLDLRYVNQEFEYSKQLADNAALVFAYRSEAKRMTSARCLSFSSRSLNSDRSFSTCLKKGLVTERLSSSSIPSKAVTDASLRQLSNILDKETRFTAVQNNLNKHLKQVSRAIESMRPFSYSRQFTSLKHLSPAQKSWDNRPTDSPHRIDTLRKNLEIHKWYEELITMMFSGNQWPSKPELDILSYIANILERGLQFSAEEYVKLLKQLEEKGADLNYYATSRALNHIRFALQIPDEIILEGYLRRCNIIPAFLSSIDVPKNYSRLSSRLSASSRAQRIATRE